jgi:hypothetical protein
MWLDGIASADLGGLVAKLLQKSTVFSDVMA